MRSDLSCTLYISDPKDYQGGELAIQLGTRTLTFKGPAGTAVVFRTSTQPLGASSIQNDAAGSG
jgi:PKHD-type hydroxylase